MGSGLARQPDWVQPFEINPIDRIFLDGVEVELVIDGDNGKVFQRVGGNGREIVMTNAAIAQALETVSLIVERSFYNPLSAVRPGEARALRDLSEKQQEGIAFRLEWATALARYQAEVGGVAHDDRRKVVRLLHAQYVDTLETAKAREHFKRKMRTYEQEQFDLGMPSFETVAEWLRKLKHSGGDPRSLRDRRGSGERKSAFTDEELHIQGHFVRRYCSTTKPEIAYLFKLMKVAERRLNRHRPQELQLDLGSRSTFYERIKALPDFVKYLGRQGEAKAKAKYTIVIGKNRGLPMDLVEADECRLDLAVILAELKVWDKLTEEEQEAYRKASERLWFSAVIDHATDTFLAFRIHERAPSTITALATFELMTRDKTDIARQAGCRSKWDFRGGLRHVRLDSASWYRSSAVTSTLTDAGCTKSHPPAKVSSLRGTIERLFGVIGQMTLNNFSGRTFSDIATRGDQDPRKGASVDVAMLEKVFLRAIVDIHHNMRNSGKLGGMTPRQAWMDGCDIKKPPAPPTGSYRRHIYGVNLKRVVTTEGICIIGFQFQSDDAQAMRRFRTGVQVDLRLDPWDLGQITVFDGIHSYNVDAREKRLKGMSFWQATALLDDLDVIDTEYTDRTRDDVDAAFEFIDHQADIARVARSVATPILTDEHIERVERQVRRPLRVTSESEYTREVRDQDWSRTPFLEAAWGLTDPPEGDDLDIPASQSEEAVKAKYGEPERRDCPRGSSQPNTSRTTKPAEIRPRPGPEADQDKPRSTDYFEEF